MTIRRLVLLAVLTVLSGALVPLGSPTVPAHAASTWGAGRWIWTGSSTTDQWVAFRGVADVGAVPSSAVTRFAADSKYWLWVNGTLVTFEGGLKRGPDPTGTYYDERDLAPFLTTGRNTIAVLVWYFGKQGFSHNSSGQGGLLVDGDVFRSGPTWKATVHAGYQHETGGTQPNYRLAESNVFYDARAAASMADWQSGGYADGTWGSAVDRGAPGAAPWNGLVKRPIPPFRFSGLRDYVNAATLPTGGTGGTVVATLPSNLQVTPYLRVDAPAGAVIGMQTDHYTDGGEPNVRATYVTTGGVQEFEALGWMSGTAVRYTVPSGVRIQALRYRESGYDTDFAGGFDSDDPFFDTLWQKAARTMYVNMRDTYFDCPTRERAQWWGDVVNQLKEGFYTFDPRSHDLGRKAIAELAAWQKPGGQLYAPVPAGNWGSELPTQMLASIWSLWTFYTYTADAATVSAAYPAVKRYLNLWTLDGDGLVAHRAGDWDWEDWGGDIDARVLDNAWSYLALDTAIKLAELSGDTGDVSAWQARKASIAANFNRVLWTGTAYRSPGYSGDTDDRGNALAVVAGLAEPAQYPALKEVLHSHFNASPYLEFYVLEALYQMQDPLGAVARMRARYADQVNDPGYTLWEVWNKNGGTDNHAWNGGPLYALSAYAVGVRPTAPGYRTFQVSPQPGAFTTLHSVVPTVQGSIDVRFDRPTPAVATLRVSVPAGTSARVDVPTLGLTGVTISRDGTTVFTAPAPPASVPFTVSSGTTTFQVTGSAAGGLAATSNNSLENSDWGINRLVDGLTGGVTGAKGYTSNGFNDPDVSGSPVWVEVDLGADRDVDALRLFPRTDTAAAGGGSAGFPADFSIQARPAGAASFTTVRTVTGAANPQGAPQTYGFAPTRARYLRVQATRLGARAGDEAFFRLQLAELTVPAAGTVVTSNNSLRNADWDTTRAYDGITTSVAGAKGYTSNEFNGPDITGSPVWVELDLGADRPLGTVTLFPRTDTAAAGGGSAGFPTDFTIQVRSGSGTGYTTVRTVTGQPNPAGAAQTYTFATTTARYVRIQVTRLGAPANDEPYHRLQLAEIRL
ncbi:discoidin domain-containing protein [Dactylosporangium siamense]|uniref:F5/8 type C domain-containing protein n=1 Tax=Dactylosporangium siamense TaxID=685454 RepID=A0A919UG18_9ACTN|nr:discoidin domain-containing protein [Dactylosporangium siamense]GIG50786.1 hypothetical protein Dsi01nite_088270 [Dactylosporangium siamense]